MENLVSAQKLLEGEELALAKVTARHALFLAGTDVPVTDLGSVTLTCLVPGGRAAPVSHLHELQEPQGVV